MSSTTALPVTMNNHCSAFLNPDTIILAGGRQNNALSSATYFFTISSGVFTNGPAISSARQGLSCGRILKTVRTQDYSVIVAGGARSVFGISVAASNTDVYDQTTNTWKSGPAVPVALYRGAMVEYPGGGVLLTGGLNLSGGDIKAIYRLQNADVGSVWETLPATMSKGRNLHTAFLVPYNLTGCLGL